MDADIDQYINQFPPEVSEKLNQIRDLVKTKVSEANPSISYGMPAYKYKGKPLIYFAGYKNHIGLYATPNAHKHFENELAGYKQGKGSVQFPLSDDLPLSLIERMIAFNKSKIDA